MTESSESQNPLGVDLRTRRRYVTDWKADDE
jgi:hypothetical protein